MLGQLCSGRVYPRHGNGSCAPLVSAESITLADAHLPIFAGQLTRSIFNQGLKGNLSHLAGVVLSNSSDAIRTLYDLWQRHIPGQWSALVDVPAILEGDANHRLFKSAMLNFVKELEKLGAIFFNRHRCAAALPYITKTGGCSRKAASLLGASPQQLSAETYLDAVLSGFLISKDRHNVLLRDLLEASSAAPAVSHLLP